MRRPLIILGILVVAAVTLVLAWRFHRLGRAGHSPGSALSTSEAAFLEDEEATPRPAVSLQINSMDEMVVAQGTPLIFNVRLGNPSAVESADRIATNENRAAELRDHMARGTLPKDKEETLMERIRPTKPVGSVQIGAGSVGPDHYLRFAERLPDGGERALSWPLQLLPESHRGPAVLDAQQSADLDYALAPAAAQAIAAGDYRLVAILEVPGSNALPATAWEGRSDSVAVVLKITPRQADQRSEDELFHLRKAQYFYATGDLAQALSDARAVVKSNPHSLAGQSLLGDILEQQGDLREAFEAYQRAVEEFGAQFPKSRESPLSLLFRESRVREKLVGKR